MNYKRCDIVIVPFPFVRDNGKQEQKARPAMVISDHRISRRYRDKIMAGITSRVPDELRETEIPLESNENTGLAKRSILRLDYLMTVPTSIISRKIGSIDSEKAKTVNEKLALSLGVTGEETGTAK